MTRVLVPMANGFEEIEAITIIDLLRRAEFEVVTAGLEATTATGNHGISVVCDSLLADVSGDFDMIALPGGMPGAAMLRGSEEVREWVLEMVAKEKYVAAICAAPMALAAAGVLDGKRATSYPGFLDAFPEVRQTGAFVEQDGRLITARGPGAAMDFALKLIEVLAGQTARDAVASRLQRPEPS